MMINTILVIEDDTNLLSGMRDILELENYQVFTATNGREGFLRLHQMINPPDVIVCDYYMPHMDGPNFLKYLRMSLDWSEIPLIMMIPKGVDVRYFVCMDKPSKVLKKPFDAMDFLIAIDRLIRYR